MSGPTEGAPLDALCREWDQRSRRSAARLHAASDELTAIFAQATESARRSAALASDAVSHAELRTRPPPDMDEIAARLSEQGPSALSTREKKALILAPGRLGIDRLQALLASSPALVRQAGRLCLMQWPAYVGEPWGMVYESALRRTTSERGVRLLEARISTSALLSRSAPRGDDAVAALLPSASIQDAYEHLKSRIGVRDSWLFSSSVLAAWLSARFREGAALDQPFAQLMAHERLRALLLPPLRAASGGLPVRSSTATQALVVTIALCGAFANPPLLQHATLAALVDHLLKSTFDDPRSSLRSDGWLEVCRLSEPYFRRLLAALCEQDLDVFFHYAMNEPDRRKFWLRYLSDIERTGCVLDRGLREQMSAKLQGVPELSGALERAHCFKSASSVQAFFLVFTSIVVVEFSHTGNAAYVYAREFFSSKIEPHIRSGRIETERALKLKEHAVHRIRHHSGWQADTADWLASEGIHARRR